MRSDNSDNSGKAGGIVRYLVSFVIVITRVIAKYPNAVEIPTNRRFEATLSNPFRKKDGIFEIKSHVINVIRIGQFFFSSSVILSADKSGGCPTQRTTAGGGTNVMFLLPHAGHGAPSWTGNFCPQSVQ
jgi:hypothetical protein